MTYTVNMLAKVAGVSVRTLHYYDEIGLLNPSSVKENGYRGYEEKERLKLEQILFFKELDFPLEEIINIMNSPSFDIHKALIEQRKYLKLKRARINNLLNTLNKTIITLKNGGKLMPSRISNMQNQIDEYKKEAKERWGNTETYRQSQERTKNWTKADYTKLAEDGVKFNRELAEVMERGYDSPEFQALIAKHYAGMQVFYDCSLEMYRGLGEMYVTDPRFRETYDQFKPGLAEVMKQAINYYCDHR